MTNPVQERLRAFAVDLLSSQGGLVEWPDHEPQGLAVLPQAAAAALECSETTPLATEAVESGLSVNLASLFVERAERLFPKAASVLGLRIESLYLKKSAMDEPVARAFGFPNARVKVSGTLPDRLEYQFWHVAASIESDERWDDLLSFAINSRTGTRLDLPDPLGNTDARVAELEEPMEASAAALGHAAALARGNAASFIARLEHRMGRDIERVRGYYEALLDESNDWHQRSLDAATRKTRREAVQLEMDRKLDELKQRYALRPSLRPVAVVRLSMPALAVEVSAQRRDAESRVKLYWNALTKTLEPLSCGICGENTFMVCFAQDFSPVCKACFSQKAGSK